MTTVRQAEQMVLTQEGLNVDADTGCWYWPGEPPPVSAFWEAAYDELPEDLVIFHVCAGGPRGCVRPSHMDCARERDVPAAPLAGEELQGFARRMRDERDARRYSQPAMAKHLGVSASTLRRWEQGERMPDSETYRKLERRLGWDNKPRKWVVSCVHQRVIVAASAGEAVREMWDGLERRG